MMSYTLQDSLLRWVNYDNSLLRGDSNCFNQWCDVVNLFRYIKWLPCTMSTEAMLNAQQTTHTIERPK